MDLLGDIVFHKIGKQIAHGRLSGFISHQFGQDASRNCSADARDSQILPGEEHLAGRRPDDHQQFSGTCDPAGRNTGMRIHHAHRNGRSFMKPERESHLWGKPAGHAADRYNRGWEFAEEFFCRQPDFFKNFSDRISAFRTIIGFVACRTAAPDFCMGQFSNDPVRNFRIFGHFSKQLGCAFLHFPHPWEKAFCGDIASETF